MPLARELAKSADDLTLIELMDAAQIMSWPFMAPPGIPEDRAAILQRAFMETQADPAYIEDADKQKMELSPISGDAIAAMLRKLEAGLTPDLLARYTAMAARTKSGAKQ